jgi:hypothetical protein
MHDEWRWPMACVYSVNRKMWTEYCRPRIEFRYRNCAYTCTVLICTIHLLQIDNATFLVREQFRVFLVVLVFLREEVIQVGIEVQRNINLVFTFYKTIIYRVPGTCVLFFSVLPG